MNTLLLEINGVEYKNFERASIRRSIDTVSGDFDFIAVTTQKNPIPFEQGNECKIIVDGATILTGYIESIQVDYEVGSHSINFSGRSKTADLIDSTIGALEIKPSVSLKEVIESVLSHIQSTIKVIDTVGTLEDFNKAEETISPSIGQNAFDFVEELARKRHVLLTDDGQGNVVIIKPGTDTGPISLQNVIGRNDNNIKGASMSWDDNNRFNRYIFQSQTNVSAANDAGETSSAQIVDAKSTSISDPSVRASRQLVMQAENNSSNAQLNERALWEANIRNSRAISYNLTHHLFSIDGKLWAPNQLVPIKDDFAGIDRLMLLSSVTYSLDNTGTSCQLSFVHEKAYTLTLAEPSIKNVTKKDSEF